MMVPPHAERLDPTEPNGQETWSAEGQPVLIHYPTVLLRSLIADAVKAFCVIPAGGIEIGGLLYGTRKDDGVVNLVDYRRFECEYKFGPSFVLSEADEERLGELIRAGHSDASLSVLELAGWFHSHTRSGVFLSDADLRIYERFFPEPWQVALVLRPQALKPTRAGFFFREADGKVHADASYHEFEVGGRTRQRRETDLIVMPTNASSPEPAVRDEISALPPPVALEPAPAPDEPAPASVVPAASRFPIQWWIWLGGVAAVVLACIAALWIFRGSSTAPEISLRMRDSNGFVMVEWDPLSPVVSASSNGRLEIRDGGGATQSYDLAKADLQGGRVLCLAQSKRVEVRMRLFGADRSPRDFVATFNVPARQPGFGAPAQGPTSNSAAPVPAPAPLEVEPVAATPPTAEPPKPEPVKAEIAKAEPARPEPAKPEPAKPGPDLVAQSAPAPRPSIPVAELRLPPRPAGRAPEMASPPPSIAVSPTNAAPPITNSPLVPAAPPPPPVAKEQPRVRAPKSGRAIWTGELRPGETLTLENGRVTRGVISGSLPQAPARIRANAAELGEGSMAIYTGDPAFRDRAGAFESPSARNGWNLTTYKWDPKRSRELSVLESPGAGNGWRKLAVRAVSRKLTMIVLDWQELPQATEK